MKFFPVVVISVFLANPDCAKAQFSLCGDHTPSIVIQPSASPMFFPGMEDQSFITLGGGNLWVDLLKILLGDDRRNDGRAESDDLAEANATLDRISNKMDTLTELVEKRLKSHDQEIAALAKRQQQIATAVDERLNELKALVSGNTDLIDKNAKFIEANVRAIARVMQATHALDQAASVFQVDPNPALPLRKLDAATVQKFPNVQLIRSGDERTVGGNTVKVDLVRVLTWNPREKKVAPLLLYVQSGQLKPLLPPPLN